MLILTKGELLKGLEDEMNGTINFKLEDRYKAF